MVEIDLSYDGDLRCTARHGPSGTQILTDAPTDNLGKGQSFSPTDLLATALGTCILTTMAIVAQRIGVELKGAKAHVTKEMTAHPTRRIGKITVKIDLPVAVTAEQKHRLEAAGAHCPVHKSLSHDVQVVTEYHWAGI
ncbi:MAG TPA: OsmC family protein [Tepidisphaeraceae bacterium]|nr:OsmC family protein [Tepidisphaeraceae bacterium]